MRQRSCHGRWAGTRATKRPSSNEPEMWDTAPLRGCWELTANTRTPPTLLRGSSAPHPPTAPCPDTLRGDGVWVAAPGAEGHGQFQRHVSWLCGSQIHRPSSFHHGVFLTKLYNT